MRFWLQHLYFPFDTNRFLVCPFDSAIDYNFKLILQANQISFKNFKQKYTSLKKTFLCLSLHAAPNERMAENSRMSKLSSKDDECVFSWKLFTGWDFMIGKFVDVFL